MEAEMVKSFEIYKLALLISLAGGLRGEMQHVWLFYLLESKKTNRKWTTKLGAHAKMCISSYNDPPLPLQDAFKSII